MNYSVGIILTDGDKILLCHVTGKYWWDLPKGNIDNNETPKETCFRELEEETGIIFSNYFKEEELKDLGVFQYQKNKKDLHLFLLKDTELTSKISLNSLTCTSFFITSNGKKLPEMDDFAFIDKKHINKFCSINMKKVLNKVFKENIL
jgi:8-oxo-dGTP pyrophosphatase MutT (NUDIX family)